MGWRCSGSCCRHCDDTRGLLQPLLNDEVAARISQLPGPAPLAALVENDVAADVHATRCRIEEAVSLGTRLIPDEDGAPASVIKLLQPRRRDLHVCDAPERSQVVDAGWTPSPELVGSLAPHALRGGAVQQIYCRRDRLPPEHPWQLLGL